MTVGVLTFTTLYPNAARPVHGIFVENRIRHLAASGEADIEVVAPIPWFPFDAPMFGRYAMYARAPSCETRHGLRVHHPRFPVIPAVGMSVAPLLLYLAVKRFMANLIKGGRRFDVIDAHYVYPDGVAAALLARDLGLPFVMTGRGSDLNVIPRYALPRRQISWAIGRAAAVITVSGDLRRRSLELGAPPDRVHVLRNGVSLETFHPHDRDDSRARLSVSGPMLLCVGNLIPLKGHDLALHALADILGATLVLVGDGTERARLAKLAEELGVTERVRFLGRVAHSELAAIYSAADALLLPSMSEGWANVLLEAMACGTPVVATTVGGNAEVVADPAAGVLIGERSVAALTAGIRRLLDNPPDRTATRAYAEKFDWQATTDGQLSLFRSIVASSG